MNEYASAEYKEQVVCDYKNNPLIEALSTIRNTSVL